jgi:hypothetical protein
MKTVRLAPLLVLLVCWLSAVLAGPELPPAARDVLTQFEQQAADLERQTTADILKCRERGVADLKKLQEDLTREDKLDDAETVRTLIRLVELGAPVALPPTLSPVVRKAYRDFEEEVSVVYQKAVAEFARKRQAAIAELQKIQDIFCKEAKLDEAVAVRDCIRTMRDGKVTALPDPGYVNSQPADIGKTFYYDISGLGASAGYAVYGTDVYAPGSYLATTAVHCGVLKEGERAVVKVTIVPGQDTFPGSTRNRVTSQDYGRAEYGFKVERVYSFQVKPFVDYPFRKGSKKKG